MMDVSQAPLSGNIWINSRFYQTFAERRNPKEETGIPA
jgi:hypothetical protein